MERAAENLLLSTFKAWPHGRSARFLITPGGFLQSDLPSGLSGCSGWSSSESDFGIIQRAAERVIRRIVTPRVLKQAVGKAHSLTIGIDLVNSAELQIQLVAFIRTADGRTLRWTGKSYPTAYEEKRLIQVVNLESHCLHFEGDRVLILGCHDLNMFNPRGWNNQIPSGERRKRCSAMRSIVASFRPSVILQHPHTTDSVRIWRQPWASLEKCLTLNDWASGICFYREDGRRGTLEEVATATRCTKNGLDFVFHTSGDRIDGPSLLIEAS